MSTSTEFSTSNLRVKYSITINLNNQSIENNSSNVTVSVKFWRTNTGYVTAGDGVLYCKIDGTQYSVNVASSQKITSSGIILFAKTLDISHNQDGFKSLTCSSWINLNTPLTSNEQFFTEQLPTISGASTFTVKDGDIGEETEIYISKRNEDYRHTLYYDVGSSWVTIASNVDDHYTWIIPVTFYELIPKSNEGIAKIWCETYLGNTYIGTSSKTFKFHAVNSNPVFSDNQLSYEDINSSVTAITGNNQWIVQNFSDLKVSWTNAQAVNSASIDHYELIWLNQTQTISSPFEIGNVNLANNEFFKITAVDSRGNKTFASKQVTIFEREIPISNFDAKREDNFQTIVKLKPHAFCSSVNEKNSIQNVFWRSKKTSDSDFSDWASIPNETESEINLDNSFAWNLQLKASDKFGESEIEEEIIPKGVPLLFFDTNLRSTGFNQFPIHNSSIEAKNLWIDGQNYMTDVKWQAYFGSTGTLPTIQQIGSTPIIQTDCIHIGRICYITGVFTANVTNAGTGDALFTNLPFPASSGGTEASPDFLLPAMGGWADIKAIIYPGEDKVRLFHADGNEIQWYTGNIKVAMSGVYLI
jgi:hypothetical protein